MAVAMPLLLPLAISVVGTFKFMTEDVSLPAKLLMLAMTAASLVLTFAVPVHFLVPFALQMIVSLWVVIYWQLD